VIYGDKAMIDLNKRLAFTLTEVMIALFLFVIISGAVYKVFFAEVRNIKAALEHIGVNESARQFFAMFGNDVRNSNWVDYPAQTNRETVPMLLPLTDGTVCVLRRQEFDFLVKPPADGYLNEETIEYYLEKRDDGSSDLYRRIKKASDGALAKGSVKKVCDGIGELLIFTTNRKPLSIKSFSAGLPFKSLITHEPYTLDGTGPYLLHVYATFVRTGKDIKVKDRVVHRMKTCFNIRGNLNGVVP
jgi:prepilin-type N-terminal cleavage/methylation domain-containing protein